MLDLQVRAGALREAETISFNDRFNQEEATMAWEASSDEGYKFRAPG